MSFSLPYTNGFEDACKTDPSSNLCSVMCEYFPLEEDYCNKAGENKQVIEANAESVISKCLNNTSSEGCNPSMTHLIRTCETFNYLLDYCDREKLTKSFFYKFYIIEHDAEVGVPPATTMNKLNISSEDVDNLLSEVNSIVSEIKKNVSNDVKTENKSYNVTGTAMDEVREILDLK